MICSKCGKEIDYNGKFCIHCGEVIQEVTPNIPNVNSVKDSSAASELPSRNPSFHMEKQIQSTQQNDTNHQYNQTGGQNMDPNQQEYMSQPMKPSKKKFVIPAIAAAFVLVAILCVVLFTTSASGGFYTASIDALNKNLNSNGFDFTLSMGEENNIINFDGSAQFQPDKKELSFKLTISNENKAEIFAFYDNYFFRLDEFGNVQTYVDYTKEMERFWEVYEENIESVKNIEDLDIEEAINELAEKFGVKESYINTLIDVDKFKECLKEFAAQWDDKEFLEDNFSYKKDKGSDGTTYSLTITMQTLLREMVKAFEPAILMLSTVDLSSVPNAEIGIDVTEDSGYLSAIKLRLIQNSGDQLQLHLTFENMNKPSIDLDELERYKESVN